jgi:F5/8 type C domain
MGVTQDGSSPTPSPGDPGTARPRADWSRSREVLLVCAVFLWVAGAHVWTIWMAPSALSFSARHVHTDNVVILMMGKHILEKGEFPIFYYGQDWFGSLSAIVHAAVFFVLGGIPPWSIHVAPLLFFLGFCLALYLLARDVLGPAAAVCALLWNVVTPLRLSEYAVTPHGGYVEALTLGTVVLWLSVRLVAAQGTWRKRGYHVLLGLAGGLAWWTSPLVIYAVLAAGAYVVLRDKLAAVWRGAVLSLPAFFVGAAPFFYFYATDPYSSATNLGGGYALGHIPAGLYLLFAERVPQYLDWGLLRRRAGFGRGLAAVVYGWATLFFLWRLRKSLRGQHPLRHAAVFPIFFAIFVLMFSASSHIRRDSPQYVIPLSAFFPVALGFWLVHAPPRWRPLVWSGGAALFLLHGWTTATWVVRNAPRAEGRTQAYLQLIGRLEAMGVNRLYTPARPGAEMLNFYSRERIIASQMTQERYEPNFDALERAPAPAFLKRQEDVLAPTLKALRASYETEQLGTYHLIHGVREMGRRYRQVPASALRASVSHGTVADGQLVDRDMRSLWTSAQPKTPGMWVTLDLGKPYTVGMARLWSPGQYHGNYAMDLRVETSVDGRTWHEALERSRMDYLYWSGPRVYGWEWGYRWEARFAATEARFMRIAQYEQSSHHPWVIAEAYVYEDVGVRAPGATDEGRVLTRIQERGLTRVYADRWMSARIADASRTRVETIPPFTVAMAEFYVRLKSRVIEWDARTGFVLEDSDADEFERLLREEGAHRLSREDFGRWVLFSVQEQEPGDSRGTPRSGPGWWWAGLGAVKTDPRGDPRSGGVGTENPR